MLTRGPIYKYLDEALLSLFRGPACSLHQSLPSLLLCTPYNLHPTLPHPTLPQLSQMHPALQCHALCASFGQSLRLSPALRSNVSPLFLYNSFIYTLCFFLFQVKNFTRTVSDRLMLYEFMELIALQVHYFIFKVRLVC